MSNNPLKYTDPTGHMQYEDDVYADNDGKCENNGKACYDMQEQIKKRKEKPFQGMKPGDIITFELGLMGENQIYNYMLARLDDGAVGFWDLDSHTYVRYELAISMVGSANSWTSYQKTDPKTFNSYEVMSSSGSPAALPSYDVSWTGGMDDNPAYIEIHTDFDWENAPTEFAWAISGPYLLTSIWGNAKPTVTPLSPTGYWPLTNYIGALAYFANDGAALARYPIIHP